MARIDEKTSWILEKTSWILEKTSWILEETSWILENTSQTNLMERSKSSSLKKPSVKFEKWV